MVANPQTQLGLAIVVVVFCHNFGIAQSVEPSFEPTSIEFFEKEIRPRLVEHCFECHSRESDDVMAGLFLDSRQQILEGGDSGAAISLEHPESSLLLESIRYEGFEMPPSGKLDSESIEKFEQWIALGAPWPKESLPNVEKSNAKFDLEERRANHWAWHPIMAAKAPDRSALGDHAGWPRDDIDMFVAEKWLTGGVSPAPDVAPEVLMRRAYADLIGLPPSSEQVAAFLEDPNVSRYENLVDDLLDSPHFGERWGRHWLDLVRYAETCGHEFDYEIPNAFQYRDYVIRAFNQDVSHNQLIQEHIAGDLLDEPRLNPEEGFNESILGTGFWRLGEAVHSPVDILKDESDRFDNMIDVMSKTFLGLTVSCARCHDHKFDAISTADYYALTGFLQSSQFVQSDFSSGDQRRITAKRLEKLDRENSQALQQMLLEKFPDLAVEFQRESSICKQLKPYSIFEWQPISSWSFPQDPPYVAYAANQIRPPKKLDDSTALEFSWVDSYEFLPEVAPQEAGRGRGEVGKLAQLPRAGRTWRSPKFELATPKLVCRVRGEGEIFVEVDSHRILNGPLHGETLQRFDRENEWVTFDLARYVGHRVHVEVTPSSGSQVSILGVFVGAPAEAIEAQRDFDSIRRDKAQSLSSRVSALLESEVPLRGEVEKMVTAWKSQREDLLSQSIPPAIFAPGLRDGDSENAHVYIRGNSSNQGRETPKQFLTALRKSESEFLTRDFQAGSGRLALADAMLCQNNPFSARVAVNRIWHHLLGKGIVASPDDFGVLGERPTHPELLDYLASEFIANGQSWKYLIRRIMLSRTYQMSGRPSEISVVKDPSNHWIHHRPPKRLEGEIIRDHLLAISGRLDPSQYGPSIPIHLTAFMDGRGKPKSGPEDGDGRRSIYLAIRRNFLSPFFSAFDAPTPFSSMGRRSVSNVPGQALILMNDPFVQSQCRLTAERLLNDFDQNEARVDWLYRSIFARSPNEAERELVLEFISTASTGNGSADQDVELWVEVVHALINTKEFVFIP